MTNFKTTSIYSFSKKYINHSSCFDEMKCAGSNKEAVVIGSTPSEWAIFHFKFEGKCRPFSHSPLWSHYILTPSTPRPPVWSLQASPGLLLPHCKQSAIQHPGEKASQTIARSEACARQAAARESDASADQSGFFVH